MDRVTLSYTFSRYGQPRATAEYEYSFQKPPMSQSHAPVDSSSTTFPTVRLPIIGSVAPVHDHARFAAWLNACSARWCSRSLGLLP